MTVPQDSESGFVVERGFRPQHRDLVAAGYWEAFSRKLRYPLGPERKALAFIARILDPAHAIGAVSHKGDFLGVAGFKTPDGAFVGGKLMDLAAIYGWPSAVARGLLIGLLERQVEPGSLLMDGIFVHPEARSLGVGSALLDAIEAHAVASGLAQIRLDVIDANPRARSLYERRGFVERARVAIGPLQPVFGFSAATTMVKIVG